MQAKSEYSRLPKRFRTSPLISILVAFQILRRNKAENERDEECIKVLVLHPVCIMPRKS